MFLKDIWPSTKEINSFIRKNVTKTAVREEIRQRVQGRRQLAQDRGDRRPDLCVGQQLHLRAEPAVFRRAAAASDAADRCRRARVFWGCSSNSITTDHISPAGSIKQASPAGKYLIDHHVKPIDFNQYGTRRGNHEVMMRGTFANIRIKNQMVPGVEGGVTIHYPDGEQMPIYDAAMRYKQENVPLVVFAGKEYGTGSSRDWAAKGTILLGIRAVITQSFERIHRSNLVGMGVLPLVFEEGTSWQSLGLKGRRDSHDPRRQAEFAAASEGDRRNCDGGWHASSQVPLICRIDTLDELEYFKNGGILQYVLRQLAA